MKKHLHLFILLLAGAAFILSFYHRQLLHPDDYLFNDLGDGIKNYFTYAWHIKYDSSCVNFEGMNYPYGEHFLYTDCHPALAGFLKAISPGNGFISAHSIGILNFILIFTIFLDVIICYFLLREFAVSRWIAILFGLGMAMLAPQVFRLAGHFALSYSLAIPLSWLLLLKALKSRKMAAMAVLVFLNGLLWMFIHAYLGVMIMAFLVLITGVELIRKINIIGKQRYIVMAAAIVLPVILFYSFLKLTDTHTGRTDNPSGFFLYQAEPDDIFLPHTGPFREFLDRVTGDVISQEWEARGYVGLTTVVILIAAIISLTTGLFRKKKRLGDSVFRADGHFRAAMISSVILLLFAMTFPFQFWPALLDYLPVFKQFRAAGRFAWPFYFTALVFSAIVIQNVFDRLRAKEKTTAAYLIAGLAGLLIIVEAIPYHREMSASTRRAPNYFRADLLPDHITTNLAKVDPSDYQAIISLPFYYYGSESFSRPRKAEAVRNSILVAYHTGLPLVNAELTRTSIAESKKIVQVISPDFYPKAIRDDLSDERPFLVVKTGDKLTEYERELLGKCQLVSSKGNIEIYLLRTEDLFRQGSIGMDSQLYETPSQFILFQNFEDRVSDTVFEGIGAFSSRKTGKNILAELAPGAFEAGKDYHLSIWMFNGEPDALNLWFRLIVEEYDEAADTWHETTFFPEEAETINGDWSLVEGLFRVHDPGNKVYIVTKGKADADAAFHADDLLIRESGKDFWSYDTAAGVLNYNNHRLHLK